MSDDVPVMELSWYEAMFLLHAVLGHEGVVRVQDPRLARLQQFVANPGSESDVPEAPGSAS